jgi:hypothetical protein
MIQETIDLELNRLPNLNKENYQILIEKAFDETVWDDNKNKYILPLNKTATFQLIIQEYENHYFDFILVTTYLLIQTENHDTKYHKVLYAELIENLLEFAGINNDENRLIVLNNFMLIGIKSYWYYSYYPVSKVLEKIQKEVKGIKISETLHHSFVRLYDALKSSYNFNTKASVIDVIIKSTITDYENVALADENDNFGGQINNFIADLTSEQKNDYYNLLTILKKTAGGKPTNKFYATINPIISKIGYEKCQKSFITWLNCAKKAKPEVINRYYTIYFQETNTNILKGILWSLDFNKIDSDVKNLIVELTDVCYTKIPGKGPAAVAVGNACIYVLAQSGLSGVSQLSRLKLRIKQSNTQELIQKYIIEAAEKLGVSPEEIEDMSVSNYGLENGELIEEFGEYSAKLSIIAIGKTEIKWSKRDGSSLKTEPSVVKKDFANDLKELKNANVQIQKMLSAQRDRLDRTLIQDRTWTWQNFNQYYVEHGLMSYLSDSLIWEFINDDKQISGFKLNGNWVSVNEDIIQGLNEQTSVKLWHPANKTTDAILDWRNFLIKNQIKQPIKQAFREIYLLTDAEVNTRNYSNRMAAHILKQHQFNTLAKLRGWKYSLLGAYDKGYESEIARINLPKYKMRAEFWISEVNADNAWNDTGIWYYISTDQVRFIDTNENPVNLLDVPAIVFSEIMRDVDLFVGVASVGNDPEWRDNGGLQQFRNYWESYSFGELGELAKTRKEALERLIPRLKIAKVAEIRDKFVVVKGKIRTYKIHIGSGNILMEPNDQYLCIVADRSSKNVGTENVFLPFEGDAVLSIILSKAFLLADDDKITDSTIISQINNK